MSCMIMSFHRKTAVHVVYVHVLSFFTVDYSDEALATY